MPAIAEIFPTFAALRQEYGFANAYQKWLKHHRAEERVLVEPWDPKVFIAVHNEVANRQRAKLPPHDRFCHQYDRPHNSPYEVTPTGARLPVETRYDRELGRLVVVPFFDPALGPRVPVDPPSDVFLRLYWQLAYWETREDRALKAFWKLKKQIEVAISRGVRDASRKEELTRLHKLTKEIRGEMKKVERVLEPMQPRCLREATAEEAKIEQASVSWQQEQNAKFDDELRGMEL